MKKTLLWLMAGLVCLSGGANAADWMLVATDFDQEIAIDRQSIRGDRAGAWFKSTYTPPKEKECERMGEKIEYELMFIEVDCKQTTLRIKKNIAYSESRSVLNACSYDSPSAAFSEVAPNTLGEALFKVLCVPEIIPKYHEIAARMSSLKIEWRADEARQNYKSAREEKYAQCMDEAANRPKIPSSLDISALECYED